MGKRLSLILADSDEALVQPFTLPGTEQHQALREWAAQRGISSVESDAAALRALLRAGAEALTEAALDIAYAQLAVTYNAEPHAAEERRAARDRYIARTESRS